MKKLLVPLATVAIAFSATAGTITSPYAKGGVISIVETDAYKRYVHTFTNADEAATFRNRSSQTLHARILVVGAGGAGGFGLRTASGGGGGGGGGGVLERKDIDIASGVKWTICVGKGASATTNTDASKNETAGASSISNGAECVALVPGGGNGGESTNVDVIEDGHGPTSGAAGGGGIRASKPGAEGRYKSSIFGVEYGKFSGGTAGGSYVGGGGGAGAAGDSKDGGEGLASDITGVSLVYGSGGGGGGSLAKTGATVYAPGEGGTRAGWGASGSMTDDSTFDFVKATAPEANSGCGGAGGIGGTVLQVSGIDTSVRYGTSGADGIVIIAYEICKIPFVGGEVTKIAEQGQTATYIHVFTNANDVATLENVSGEDISIRMLVVGAGGAGGFGLHSASGSGGGGGGGGVLDAENVVMPADGVWTICVGKGATATTSISASKNETAGASSISNGTECIAVVPGGGNGGESKNADTVDGHGPTSGAAGGGGIRTSTAGAAGSYPSSILGTEYGPFSGGTGTSYRGGGGGGAGEAGSSPNGGEGLPSDITGVSIVYGSGGGSGGNCSKSGTNYYGLGKGGTRAGDGAEGAMVDSVPVTVLATAPEANSGCGGAGGLGGTILQVSGVDAKVRYGTSGANGIVVIRYDWTYDPNPPAPGLMLIFR